MATTSSDDGTGFYVDVVLPRPVEGLFTYIVPREMRRAAVSGVRVEVPFGRSAVSVGLVVGEHPGGKPDFDCKPINAVLDDAPVVTADQLRLWRWIADYYMSSLGDVFKAAVPAVMRSLSRRAVAPRRAARMPLPPEECVAPNTLTPAQGDAFNRILLSFESHDVTLLHGVTSSGKTEIYIHLIIRAMEQGLRTLYLLPEIALTVQIQQRLRRVFGSRLCVYHSKTTDAERERIWRRQLSDDPYMVVLGARSAVFLPFTRLGLIIVDEEHDASFKQQDPAPRYNARSVAAVMGRMLGAKMLLGTATPSAETYHNALRGKYGLVRLGVRHGDMELPRVQVVDTVDMHRRKMMTGMLSVPLMEAMREALDEKKQVILFQNRRGYAPLVKCRECGWTPYCTTCDVPLTYHKRTARMVCHYCGKIYSLPAVCPQCGSSHIVPRGVGTERVEDTVKRLFPDARIARMDLDTTRSRSSYDNIINDLSAGSTDILIGTQMVTKGLDFDGVSVVGILDADGMLSQPDFRAYEQAFAMMSQVAGRAGRKGKRGLVVLQTGSPQLPVIRQVISSDYETFYTDLFEERSAFSYPPFTRLVYVYLRHSHDDICDAAADNLGNRLKALFGERVLGPDRPAVARVKTMSIRKIVIKLEPGLDLKHARLSMRRAVEQTLEDERFRSLMVHFDVDPL